MKFYYSQSQKGFFIDEINSLIPSDAFEINQEIYDKSMQILSVGGTVSIEAGNLVLNPPVDLENQQKLQEERNWRDGELYRADVELYKVQDTDPSAVGTVSDWRDYRKKLRAWPQSVDFPDKLKRPIAPDAGVVK